MEYRRQSFGESFLKNKSLLIFYSLLLLVIVDRTNTLIKFSFVFTDSDQTILWLAAKEFASGKFYTPCFYGQSYNPLIEPLIAVPLIKSGMSYYMALPIITTIIALTPFILLAYYFKRKLGNYYGFIPFIFLLLLPPEYGMITSMPRGFVTGIFFATLGLICIMKSKQIFDLLGGFLLGFSLFANPNSILLFPLVLPELFSSSCSFKRRFPYLFLGAIIGLVPQVINSVYFASHPEMVIHGSPDLGLSHNSFSYVIQHMSIYFNWVTPVFWKAGWISLVILGFVAWKFKKGKQPIRFYTTIILLFIICFSFFSNKVADGRDSIYFAGSRMFLSFPVILLFVSIWFLELLNDQKRSKWVMSLLIISLISVIIKIGWMEVFIHNQIREKNKTVLGTIQVKDLKHICYEIMNFTETPPDLVLASSSNSSDQLITYGCGCLQKNFPPTLQPDYDRRTWLVPKLLNKKYDHVLIHGEETEAWHYLPRKDLVIIKEDSLRYWIMISNKLRTGDLMIQTKIIQ